MSHSLLYIIAPLLGFLVVAGLGTTFGRIKKRAWNNPGGDPKLWIEAAQKIWDDKGFGSQDVRDLLITSTVLQIEFAEKRTTEAVNNLLTPLWFGISLIVSIAIAVCGWAFTNP